MKQYYQKYMKMKDRHKAEELKFISRLSFKEAAYLPLYQMKRRITI